MPNLQNPFSCPKHYGNACIKKNSGKLDDNSDLAVYKKKDTT